jgi:putative oxidoreductase
MRTLIRICARLGLSAIFVYTGYGMFNNAERYAKRAAAAIPMLPDDPIIAKVQGGAMMGLGSMLALGVLPKLSARLLALTLIPNTVIGHPFWKAKTPEERRPQLIEFLKNLGLFGGLLYVTADKRTKHESDAED